MLGGPFRLGTLLPAGVLVVACGQSTDAVAPPIDAGDTADSSHALVRDAGHPKDAGPQNQLDTSVPWNRMTGHDRRVLASMHLQVVYMGFEGDDGSPDFDEFHQWLLTSDYWALMKQYGVSAGSFSGSVRIAASAAIPPGMVKGGLVSGEDLDARVFQLLHGTPVFGVDAGDADPDGSTGDGGGPLIPAADAYLFYLPNGVNVSLGERGGHVFKTCVDAGGYHSFDGAEPYAVIPPCSFGRSPLAISHELAEMATDPYPGGGWFSDADVNDAGGEIGDLCNQQVPHDVEGWSVTQLWSNAYGGCLPN